MVNFEPGDATVTDSLSIESMSQAVWRARILPEHRIEIETHEDRADPREIGLAVSRSKVLRDFFLEKPIPEERLEMRVNPAGFRPPGTGALARRGEIHLFPRVASLGTGLGEPLLGYEEVDLLNSVFETVHYREDNDLGKFARWDGLIDWTRIVGYESLAKWVSAGARHPLFGHLPLSWKRSKGK